MTRPTDRRRDRTVTALGDGYAAGCIGTETFELRLDAAHEARTLRELRRLTRDLPVGGWLDRAREAIAARRERDDAPVVHIAPPPDGPGPWILGRSVSCPLVLDDDTVSRRHAQLRRTEAGWEILDLGSLNGTWVNGWRVERATLHAGDVVQLGELRVAIDG
jgi:FHA domain/Domain of unknown function (DUF1707)